MASGSKSSITVLPTVIDLTNYKIGDEEASGGTSTTEALFQFPAGASIAPGEVQIISGGATRFFTVYGFNPTYETAATDAGVPDMTVYAAWDPDGGILNMSNSNDQAVLVDGTDTVIDAAVWGNNFAFNPSGYTSFGRPESSSAESLYRHRHCDRLGGCWQTRTTRPRRGPLREQSHQYLSPRPSSWRSVASLLPAEFAVESNPIL